MIHSEEKSRKAKGRRRNDIFYLPTIRQNKVVKRSYAALFIERSNIYPSILSLIDPASLIHISQRIASYELNYLCQYLLLNQLLVVRKKIKSRLASNLFNVQNIDPH